MKNHTSKKPKMQSMKYKINTSASNNTWIFSNIINSSHQTRNSHKRKFRLEVGMVAIAIPSAGGYPCARNRGRVRACASPHDNSLSLKSRRIVGRYECDFQNLLWSFRGPPRWSTIAVITQLSSLGPGYPPICLFYSQISHSAPSLYPRRSNETAV